MSQTLTLRRPFDLQLFAGERTEQATPKRRQQARQKGQVLKSPDLSGALAFAAVLAVLHFMAPAIGRDLLAFTQRLWGTVPGDWSSAEAMGLLTSTGKFAVRVALPLMLVAMVVGIGATVLQSGFVFSTQGLMPQWSRVNPGQGFQRIFSTRSLVDLLKSLGKLAVVAFVAYSSVRGAAASFPTLMDMPPQAAAAVVGRWVDGLAWRVTLAFLVLAAADYFYQRWEYERSLRMSHEEIKQESKESEGDPHMKGLRRRRQREMANRRMLQEVPRATVVVANPEHFAVALRYTPEDMDAPIVLAKGQDFLAQRIKAMAREHGVPIVEDPPLARALYRTVQVGRVVPEEFFQAVAEVLAFVWRLKGFRSPVAR